ncbi:MAG TPA: hypothetical protein VKB78_15885 [Pirellulales bacterium]|nr:hypothetical protein [Pirellulales bacterium]
MCKRFAVVVAAWIGLAISGSSVFAQGGPSNLTYTPRPTVSPYLNLFNDPGGIGVYQNLVRPFINQNQINAQNTTTLNQLQQELNQVRTTSGFGTTGLATGRINPTGHAATYRNFSHFYNGLR